MTKINPALATAGGKPAEQDRARAGQTPAEQADEGGRARAGQTPAEQADEGGRARAGQQKESTRPSREDAEAAVRVLLAYTGDDPGREGLADTPGRVVRSWDEFYAGYAQDPKEMLQRTFEEIEGYEEMVVLRDIGFESHCEHHMAPIIGRAHVAYLPRNRVVGISKLARVVEAYARRLQIQEKMTAQIANIIDEVLNPHGTAVVLEATHHCMTTRGVHRPGVTMVTSTMLGGFRKDPSTRREFLAMIGNPSGRGVGS